MFIIQLQINPSLRCSFSHETTFSGSLSSVQTLHKGSTELKVQVNHMTHMRVTLVVEPVFFFLLAGK